MFTGWTEGYLTLPIELELRFIKTGAGTGLPTRIIGHRANERDILFLLAGNARLCISVALVDQRLSR